MMKPLVRHLFLLLVVGASTMAPSVRAAALDIRESRLSVVCTIGMIGDLVREIGGDRIEVRTLMGPGVDPHLYKPIRSDIARLMEADLILANGLHLEGRMDQILDRAVRAGRPVLRVGEVVTEDRLIRSTDDEKTADPHLWMDPRLWARTIPPILEALIAIDPEGASDHRRRAAELEAELLELDGWAAERLATVPRSGRVLVTAHDAFEYFGRRHGFEVVGIQGISTESEAGVRDIARIVDLLVARRVGAVFVESTVPPRQVEALVAGARARGHDVNVGGQLFSDAMGDAGTYEGTYRGMIDHNTTTIVRALGGDVPDGGRLGRLGGAGERDVE